MSDENNEVATAGPMVEIHDGKGNVYRVRFIHTTRGTFLHADKPFAVITSKASGAIAMTPAVEVEYLGTVKGDA